MCQTAHTHTQSECSYQNKQVDHSENTADSDDHDTNNFDVPTFPTF